MQIKDKFQEFIEYERNCGKIEKTIYEHQRLLFGSLSHSIQEKNINDLRLTDVALIMKAGEAHGEYGPQRSVCVFRVFLKYLHDSGVKLPFDWRDIKLPTVPQKSVEYLTEEELEKIRNCFDTNTLSGLRTRALIETLYDTGMRISEALSLNREDIEWEKRETKITNCKTKDQGETVYFTDRSLNWLKLYLLARADNFPPLFASWGGNRLTSCTARNVLRRAVKNLGIKKHIRHHIFRRTMATKLLQNKVDIKTVQTILRHKSERTTLKYYIGIDKDKIKASHQAIMEKT